MHLCPTARVCDLYELVEKVVVECTYIWRKMPQSSLLGPSLTVSVCRSRYLLCRSTLLIRPVVHLLALSIPIIVVVSGNVLPNFLYFKMIFSKNSLNPSQFLAESRGCVRKSVVAKKLLISKKSTIFLKSLWQLMKIFISWEGSVPKILAWSEKNCWFIAKFWACTLFSYTPSGWFRIWVGMPVWVSSKNVCT